MTATPQIILIHTRADDQEAEKVYQKLSEAGCKTWMAKKNIPFGQNRPEYTNKAIKESQIFLLLLSAKSFEENRSLKKDIQELISKSKEVAQNNGCTLLPVRLDDCEIPELLEDIQELDLFTSDGWTLLLTAIREIENQLKSTQKPDRFLSEAEKGNERSYTRIERLDNQQGFVIAGGTANINVDQRRNKTVNNQIRNTEPTPITQATTYSSDSQAKADHPYYTDISCPRRIWVKAARVSVVVRITMQKLTYSDASEELLLCQELPVRVCVDAPAFYILNDAQQQTSIKSNTSVPLVFDLQPRGQIGHTRINFAFFQADKSVGNASVPVEITAYEIIDELEYNLRFRFNPKNKLVIFKIGDGDLEMGFKVTLQIGSEGAIPFTEVQCSLPPAPTLISNYEFWQSIYRDGYSRIGLQRKLEARPAQKTNFSFAEFVKQCHESAENFRNSLNTWLNSEQFRDCKEACLRKINPSDSIRLIIQTEDSRLRRLPWHLWNFFDDYRKAEIALSSIEFDRVDKNVSATPRTKVRILAILGDRTGIDIEKDQAILQNLPDAECVFLAEPNRREVDNCLWDERGWDILFFAGHSSSHSNAETGKIYLNKNDSLTMGELRYALRRAIESGLQLAIFNSCDGLGIARELAGLHIPQIIAMREPVADLVAQEFLKHFLTAFSSNKSLYLAVREARERLQSLEDQFPCATWLPVICQNLAEVPPIWQELWGMK